MKKAYHQEDFKTKDEQLDENGWQVQLVHKVVFYQHLQTLVLSSMDRTKFQAASFAFLQF